MPAQIHADLTVTVDNRYQMQVTGTGDETLTVHLPTLRAAFSLWRKHRKVLASLLKQTTAPLQTLNISFIFVVKGEPVASYTPSDTPGLLSRVPGVAPFSLNLRNILRLVLKR